MPEAAARPGPNAPTSTLAFVGIGLMLVFVGAVAKNAPECNCIRSCIRQWHSADMDPE